MPSSNDPKTDHTVVPSGRRPFLSAPDVRRYFPAGAIEEARQKLTHNLERSAGTALVISGAGLGKSMLLEVLATQFSGQRTAVTLPGAQLCTRRALLQMILFQLGLPFRKQSEGELRLAILTQLKEQHAAQQGDTGRLLLLIDEAETLPVRLLEELRVLTNVVESGLPLVDLVLCGGTALEERFAEPALERFNQRVSMRCYLAPFGREETFQYVRSQLAAAGGDADALFSADGLEALHTATDGIPRLINQLGDQLAWMAEQTGYVPIDAALVQQAWAELQQLPAPWNMSDGPSVPTAAQPASSESALSEPAAAMFSLESLSDDDDANVIEFGSPDERQIERIENCDEESAGHEMQEPCTSIPFADHLRAMQSQSDIADSAEMSMDATEQLLAELGEIGGQGAEDALIAAAYSATDDMTTPNAIANDQLADNSVETLDPFGDDFEEEEVVIDPYANFEAEMLAFAPNVMNLLDSGFADALNLCALEQTPTLAAVVFDDAPQDSATTPGADTVVPDAAELEPIDPTELDEPEEAEPIVAELPIQPAEPARKEVASGKDFAIEQTLLIDQPAVDPVPAAAGILVLEDDGRGVAEVVPGRQFRQLFSGLEANGAGH